MPEVTCSDLKSLKWSSGDSSSNDYRSRGLTRDRTADRYRLESGAAAPGIDLVARLASAKGPQITIRCRWRRRLTRWQFFAIMPAAHSMPFSWPQTGKRS